MLKKEKVKQNFYTLKLAAKRLLVLLLPPVKHTAPTVHLRVTATPPRYSYTYEVQLHPLGTATPTRYSYT
jgi:hypothetical protein